MWAIPPTGPEPRGAQAVPCSPPSLAIPLPRPGLTGLGAQSSPTIPVKSGDEPRPAHPAPLPSFWAVIWN